MQVLSHEVHLARRDAWHARQEEAIGELKSTLKDIQFDRGLDTDFSPFRWETMRDKESRERFFNYTNATDGERQRVKDALEKLNEPNPYPD